MPGELSILAATAAAIGVVHTLIGPDHYLPFITLARARGWSRRTTVGITLVSGLGHVASSMLLGALGLTLGWTLGGLERWEKVRAELAGWLLLAFGLAYLAWGLRRALRARPHTHLHVHADGTAHEHRHSHLGAHAHPHQRDTTGPVAGLAGWSLFVIFVLGPCEPLIPILMYPAATGSAGGVAVVAGVFAASTLATMIGLVLLGRAGLDRLPAGSWERWSHAAAGAVVATCGAAIQLGW